MFRSPEIHHVAYTRYQQVCAETGAKCRNASDSAYHVQKCHIKMMFVFHKKGIFLTLFASLCFVVVSLKNYPLKCDGRIKIVSVVFTVNFSQKPTTKNHQIRGHPNSLTAKTVNSVYLI